MPKQKPDLSGYIEVNERIATFYDRYPEGSLQGEHWIETVKESTFVVYRAKAYRTPDDSRPGIGTTWEPFPGLTSFTRNSELENAETSAWGRALAALGLEVKRAVASKEEVANRVAEAAEAEADSSSRDNGEADTASVEALAAAANEAYKAIVEKHGKKEADAMVKMKLAEIGIDTLEEMTPEQAEDFYRYLQGLTPAK